MFFGYGENFAKKYRLAFIVNSDHRNGIVLILIDSNLDLVRLVYPLCLMNEQFCRRSDLNLAFTAKSMMVELPFRGKLDIV